MLICSVLLYSIHKGIIGIILFYILNGTRNNQKLGRYTILLHRYRIKWIFRAVFDEYDNINVLSYVLYYIGILRLDNQMKYSFSN